MRMAVSGVNASRNAPLRQRFRATGQRARDRHAKLPGLEAKKQTNPLQFRAGWR